MKTNFERLKSMSVDELAEWLDENGKFDNSLWMQWFDQKYCKNCDDVERHYESDGYYTRMCFAWCELNNRCRFFPNLDETPRNKDIIKMWLESEIKDEEII